MESPGGDGGLSSPALLSTILRCCHSAFLHGGTRGFEALCAATATTQTEELGECHVCFLALGQACLEPQGPPRGADGGGGGDSDASEHDEDSFDSVPVVLIPVRLHSAAAEKGGCRLEAAGSAFLNPLLLAAAPEFQRPAPGVSLVWALARGQPAASLVPIPHGMPRVWVHRHVAPPSSHFMAPETR
jgi:hypothetical protein